MQPPDKKAFHYVSFAKQISFPLSFVLFLSTHKAVSMKQTESNK
ncbi:hypothetical protein yinte0001_41940 [Yersinia intermedia ATCC 29909]|nr:hypothetical protein yinte0001_41940 [Yersinia intermedia ATCC 29909]